MPPERFSSMRDLVGTLPAVDNYSLQIDLTFHSAVKVFAPHAGCIEPCTAPVAAAVADGLFDLFMFIGTRTKDCYDTLHVTSARYDLPECVELAAAAEIAVAIHGCSGKESFAEVGGGNRGLAEELSAHLAGAGFGVRTPPAGRLGTDESNFINKARRKGVQIEMSEGLRRELFPSFPRPLQKNPRRFNLFVESMRSWLSGLERSFAGSADEAENISRNRP